MEYCTVCEGNWTKSSISTRKFYFWVKIKRKNKEHTKVFKYFKCHVNSHALKGQESLKSAPYCLIAVRTKTAGGA